MVELDRGFGRAGRAVAVGDRRRHRSRPVRLQGKTNPPKPLSEKIVTAWKEAGADVGWIRTNQYGYRFVQEQVGKPGDVPAFRFSVWQAGRLAKLPTPAVTFGLDLSFTSVAECGAEGVGRIQELAIPEPCRYQR